MIEHVSLHCKDVKASRKFYEKALSPLGYKVTQSYPQAVGFMAEGHTSFWIAKGDIGTPTHLAFRAKDRAAVRKFHEAALAAGAKDNGGPGLRSDYSPTYFAAFVHDPNGHNIEAVTFVRGEGRGAAGKKKKAASRTKRPSRNP